MASSTWWAWVWVNSGSWWWTWKPGVLRFMGSQESDTTEQLNWTELNWISVSGHVRWRMLWTLWKKGSGTLVECGAYGDVPRRCTLCNIVTSPSCTSDYSPPQWGGQTGGKKKNKKKHEHSQDIGFKIYSDDREREREKMDLSSFLVPPHLFESILALDNDGIYQLIICWHCSCVYCLSHQPPSMGLQAPQCVLGCSTETYKRMGWEERLKP